MLYERKRAAIDLLLGVLLLLLLLLLYQWFYFHFKVSIGHRYFYTDDGHVVQFRPPSAIVPHQESSTCFLYLLDDFQGHFFFFGPFDRDPILFRFDQTTKDDVPGMAQHGCSRSEDNIVRSWTFNDGYIICAYTRRCHPYLDDFPQA